jgi:hypothetical protein
MNSSKIIETGTSYGSTISEVGISFGSALAIAVSYSHNHSILWAILHGCFSWFYVVYAAIFYE